MDKFSGYADQLHVLLDFEWAVQLNRFGLKLLGLWPEEAASLQEKLNSNLRAFGVFLAITCICTMPSLLWLLRVWGNLMAMMENFVYTLPFLTLSLTLLILWWKREALSSLITMIAYDWIKSKSKDERNVMIRCAQNARLIITFSYIMNISSSTILIVTTAFGYTLGRYVTNITDTKKPLPLQGYYMYDTSVSPQFELTFSVQCISLIIAALSYTNTNNFLGLLIFHICGQLENLTSRLYQMRESKNFIMALRINVIDHIRLIRFVTIIEDSFTLMLLLLFLYFGVMFCTYGFMAITVIFENNNVSVKKATFLFMIICTAFIHMCIYCAVGELLVIKYEEVYKAVYEFEWYTLDMKKAKNLILLLIRTNKPLYITAGKMFPMTMATFCSIIKTSGGYVSVLLANRN